MPTLTKRVVQPFANCVHQHVLCVEAHVFQTLETVPHASGVVGVAGSIASLSVGVPLQLSCSTIIILRNPCLCHVCITSFLCDIWRCKSVTGACDTCKFVTCADAMSVTCACDMCKFVTCADANVSEGACGGKPVQHCCTVGPTISGSCCRNDG